MTVVRLALPEYHAGYGNVEIFGYKRAGGRVISKNRCVKRYVIKVIYNIARPSETESSREPGRMPYRLL